MVRRNRVRMFDLILMETSVSALEMGVADLETSVSSYFKTKKAE